MQELEKILEEIESMVYPAEGIGCGLEDISITDRYESAEYGWNEAVERITEIIRKHMNDGWIPCSERMPTEEECENEYFWVMLKYNTSSVIAKCSWIEAKDENGNDDSFSEFFIDQYPQVYTPSKDIVIAWKIVDVPALYHHERSDSHDGK